MELAVRARLEAWAALAVPAVDRLPVRSIPEAAVVQGEQAAMAQWEVQAEPAGLPVKIRVLMASLDWQVDQA